MSKHRTLSILSEKSQPETYGLVKDLILSRNPVKRHDRTLPQNAPSESAMSVTSQVRQVNLGDPNRMPNKRTLDPSTENDEQKKNKISSGGRRSRGSSGPVWPIPKEDLMAPQRITASRPAQKTSFPSSRRKSSLSQSSDVKNKPSIEHKSSSLSSRSEPEEEGIQLQPETRPITQEQLVNEVKGMSYLISSQIRLCESKMSFHLMRCLLCLGLLQTPGTGLASSVTGLFRPV